MTPNRIRRFSTLNRVQHLSERLVHTSVSASHMAWVPVLASAAVSGVELQRELYRLAQQQAAVQVVQKRARTAHLWN